MAEYLIQENSLVKFADTVREKLYDYDCAVTLIEDKSSLSSIEIYDGVTNIGDLMFYECKKLKDVIIPDSVTSIGMDAFYDCNNLTSITIPNSVTNIGHRAFNHCDNLEDVNLSTGINNIGESAFRYCKSLRYIELPGTTSIISNYMFEGCEKLEKVFNIGDSIKKIGIGAFKNCSALYTTIFNSITSIGRAAFQNCVSYYTFGVPESVESIGDYAFDGCTHMSKISFHSTTPPTLEGAHVFPSTVTIAVPWQCGDAYKTATNWSVYADQIVEMN